VDTLVLDSRCLPIDCISWQRTMTHVAASQLKKHIRVVTEYSQRVVRGVGRELKLPAVIQLLPGEKADGTWTNRVVKRGRGIRFSRQGIFARDGGRCQYCLREVAKASFSFDHVIPRVQGGIVVERDPKPEVAVPRKGVPQGRHVHALLKAGERALEGLFPGLIAELEQRGGHVFDFANDVRWHHHGVWKKRYQSGVRVHCQSRPLIELAVRGRVAANPKIQVRYQTSVEELEIKEGRVCAALLKDASSARAEKIDLAVDTSGRGSQIDRTLLAGGFTAPFEERVGIDLQYPSQMIALAPRARDFRAVLVYPKPPGDKRAGMIFPIEGGRHMVTLLGWQGDHPPADWEGFTAFARSLAQPEIARELVDCKRIGEAAIYKFPYARRKRFDQHPSGARSNVSAIAGRLLASLRWVLRLRSS
jgi:hypothetical protein